MIHSSLDGQCLEDLSDIQKALKILGIQEILVEVVHEFLVGIGVLFMGIHDFREWIAILRKGIGGYGL